MRLECILTTAFVVLVAVFHQGAAGGDCEWKNHKATNGETILIKSCLLKLKCVNGQFSRPYYYRCPMGSWCIDNKCVCVTGYKETTINGITACMAQGQCTYENRTMNNGQSDMKFNCTTLVTCRNGAVQNSAYSCPKNSKCVEEICECDDGYDPTYDPKTERVTSCKRAAAGDCEVNNRKAINGETILFSHCTWRTTCKGGEFSNAEQYQCPAGSSCVNNKCECKAGLQETITNGLVSACKVAAGGDCENIYDKATNGQTILFSHCSWRMTCKDGEFSNAEQYQCPAGSSCVNNKCVCKAGLHETITNGLVSACKVTAGGDCENTHDKATNGETILFSHCTWRMTCKDGEFSNAEQYQCPTGSSCVNNKCACKAGLQETITNGLVSACKV